MLHWEEGGLGVEHLVITTAEGSLTYVPNADLRMGTDAQPFDRATALRAAKFLAETFLRYIDEHPDAYNS